MRVSHAFGVRCTLTRKHASEKQAAVCKPRRGLLQLCCGRWFGLMRTLLFSRSTWRLRNLLPSAQAPIPGPGVSNALNREAIQQVWQ